MAGNLWPEVDEARASGCLRTGIWEVQRRCPGLLVVRGKELSLGDGVYVDTVDFERRAHRILQEPQNVSVAELAECVIWQRLLTGWYDEWVLLAQEQIRQLQFHVLETIGEEFLYRDKPGPALRVALNAVNIEPLRESAHRLVIRIHVSEGNMCEAIRHYQQYCSLLHRELGLRPTKQLQELMAKLNYLPVG